VPRDPRRRFFTAFLVTAPIPVAALLALVLLVAGIGEVDAKRSGLGDGVAGAAELPPAKVQDATISLAWAGDITPGSAYGALPGDARSLFADVRGRLRGHDIALGNLEGTLGDVGSPKCAMRTPNCYSFQAPAIAARGLRWAGFDVLNVANNHGFDYGPEAQVSTLQALHKAGIDPAGVPNRVRVLRRRGVRVAVIGLATYRWTTSMLDATAVDALVRRAARLGDVVVVVMHAGAEGSDRSVTPAGPEEYLGEQRGDVRAFARQAIDAGADVVLGSGPHVLRGMEVYRDRLIAYSLGNFAGVRNFSTAGELRLSALLSLRVTRDGAFTAGYLHPLELDASGRPTVDPLGAANAFMRAASERDFPGTAVRVRKSGKLLPPRYVASSAPKGCPRNPRRSPGCQRLPSPD